MPYIWVPKSQLNPNPNPKITAITQPSSSNSPKFNRNKQRRNKNRRNKIKNKPNWLDLPEDVWFIILSKLVTIEIIWNVQLVCKLFRKICTQPSMFRKIDLTIGEEFNNDSVVDDIDMMIRDVVDRSAGELVDIFLEETYYDDTLMYIADRAKNLKRLRIGQFVTTSDKGLTEAVRKLPMLEEVEIIIRRFSKDTYRALGHACPFLKSFSLNYVGSRHHRHPGNDEAFAIAQSMPNLHHLQLIGSCMTNEGLNAILDGCPLLESLDLRACLKIDFSGDLGKKIDKIKHFRRPNESTADYFHGAETDYDIDDDDSDNSDLGNYVDYDFDMYSDAYDDFDDFSLLQYFGGGSFFPGFDSSDSD